MALFPERDVGWRYMVYTRHYQVAWVINYVRSLQTEEDRAYSQQIKVICL